jgi:hypothetical protein
MLFLTAILFVTDAPLIEYTERLLLAGLQSIGFTRDELGPKRTMLAVDIATAAFVSPPLWPDDVDKHRTIRLLVAIAIRETSARNDIRGAQGECSAWQLKPLFLGIPSLNCAALEKDAQLAAMTALTILRLSFSMCPPGHELNSFAGGPGSCQSPKAQDIHNDRWKLAKELEILVGP